MITRTPFLQHLGDASVGDDSAVHASNKKVMDLSVAELGALVSLDSPIELITLCPKLAERLYHDTIEIAASVLGVLPAEDHFTREGEVVAYKDS